MRRMQPLDSKQGYRAAPIGATHPADRAHATPCRAAIRLAARRDRRHSPFLCVALFVTAACAGLQEASAQTNGNVGGLGEVSTSNPYPFNTLTFIGTAGHIRALNTLDLGSTVLTDDDSTARLSAVAGQTLSFRFGHLGARSTIYLGSASDTGDILVTGWNGSGGLGSHLIIDGGTVIAGPRNQFGLGDFGFAFGSTTIANGATLQFAGDNSYIRRLSGGGAIGIVGASLTIGGGTFSTSITGASRLIFTADTTWTGTGGSIGTLEVRPGTTLTTNNPAAVESATTLQIDGTHALNSNLAVDGLTGSGLIALGTGARLSAGSQNGSSTFGGEISGSGGGLTKEGTGTLTLSGNSSYTGATIVNGGTLLMGTSNALPAASDVTLNAGSWSLAGFSQHVASLTGNPGANINLGFATLTIGGGANIGYFGTISGSGGLTKVGSNSQDLYGLNSYTGPTTVSGGTLRVALGGTLPNSRAVTVNAGGDLDVAAVNALSPQARVTLNGNGARFRINADQSIGALDGTASSQVVFGVGRNLTIGGSNADSSFAGNLGADGNGSLIKTGTGRLTLSGTNSYAGSTIVNGGTLIVNGSIAASSGLALNAGATLAGSGTVPAVTVIGGTLSPGNSPGTLTIDGNLTMDAASTYRAEVQGPVADRIDVSGTAALAGTLRLVPLGGAYSFNSPYTLLSAAGGRTGAFQAIDQAGAFGDGVSTTVAYTGNEVRLTLEPRPLTPIVTDPTAPTPSGVGSGPAQPTPSPISPATGSGPANALAVAGAIDGAVAGGADASPLFNLYNLPAAAIPAAVNQLSGEAHTGVPALANGAAGRFLGMMLDTALPGRLAPSAAAPDVATFSSGAGSSDDGRGRPSFLDQPRFSLWGASSGSAARMDGSARIGSAPRTIGDGHLAVGADLRVGAGTVAGLAIAAGKARASLGGGLGKIDAGVLQVGVYGLTRLGSLDLAAAGSYSRLDSDVSRAVPLLGNTLLSSYTSTAWSGRIQASAALASGGGFTVSTLAALQAVTVRSPAFSERSAFGTNAAALAVSGRRDTTSRTELGAQIDTQALLGAVPLSAFVRTSWAHYLQRDAGITANLVALPGAGFITRGARPDRNAALIAAGLDARLSERVTLGVRVDGEVSARTRSLGGTAQLRMSF
ncbi:autotransporter-associated beta strand repeat-containing protein [Bosea sp. TND4EK4]|nr:autotransporter-associated beta strand repeat-containing protein [Bosea sp. TND4EK4]